MSEYLKEIERLRAELAAERERADRISAAADAKTEIMRKRANKWEKRAINAAEEVCDLHAELAAERDHHADALEMNNLLQKDKAELRAELAAAKIEIEKQRARVIKWVNAAMRNEEYDDDGR